MYSATLTRIEEESMMQLVVNNVNEMTMIMKGSATVSIDTTVTVIAEADHEDIVTARNIIEMVMKATLVVETKIESVNIDGSVVAAKQIVENFAGKEEPSNQYSDTFVNFNG
jgi:hypothetical protein